MATTKKFKKGDTVYQVSPWNFLGYAFARNLTTKMRDPNKPAGSAWITVPITEDQIFVQKWVIHSIGKKRAYMIDPTDASMSRKEFSVPYTVEKNIFCHPRRRHQSCYRTLG